MRHGNSGVKLEGDKPEWNVSENIEKETKLTEKVNITFIW